MQQHSSLIGIFVIGCGLLTNGNPAEAAIETWVSRTGTDSGTCQISAPCRTFAFAHGQTSTHGSINVLTAGNFGPLTITKTISIVAQGVEAVINTGANGAGIIVQTGANAIVSLRGLTIDMRGSANIGVSFVSGKALHIHDSVIRRAIDGIKFAPASGISELTVTDSVIADTGSVGIFVFPTGSGGAKVAIDRVRVENSSNDGILFAGSSTTGSIAGTVRDSVSTGNFGLGSIMAEESAPGTTTIMIDRSASLYSGVGIRAQGAGAKILIGDSTVSGNVEGLAPTGGGEILSYGTNKVNGNDTDGNPTGSVILMK